MYYKITRRGITIDVKDIGTTTDLTIFNELLFISLAWINYNVILLAAPRTTISGRDKLTTMKLHTFYSIVIKWSFVSLSFIVIRLCLIL